MANIITYPGQDVDLLVKYQSQTFPLTSFGILFYTMYGSGSRLLIVIRIQPLRYWLECPTIVVIATSLKDTIEEAKLHH